jgi:hypothetical protein
MEAEDAEANDKPTGAVIVILGVVLLIVAVVLAWWFLK